MNIELSAKEEASRTPNPGRCPSMSAANANHRSAKKPAPDGRTCDLERGAIADATAVPGPISAEASPAHPVRRVHRAIPRYCCHPFTSDKADSNFQKIIIKRRFD